ncbi:N-acetylmuramoyl-L-alanine amidase [Babesia caballi]|uniref:N-acetylmuramoyl-L-alanine amidase n=1 Tax=Babesia caballi TaxID=5871 RepID=A0AAV4LQU4_BABCB|nr:N-acetylmuramoyl-L-alanine amidase [Babesia caballi]
MKCHSPSANLSILHLLKLRAKPNSTPFNRPKKLLHVPVTLYEVMKEPEPCASVELGEPPSPWSSTNSKQAIDEGLGATDVEKVGCAGSQSSNTDETADSWAG